MIILNIISSEAPQILFNPLNPWQFFTFHFSLFTLLVASGSKWSLKLKRKIIFKILNDNSKYNFKRSAPNPFKSFKSQTIFHFSFFTFLVASGSKWSLKLKLKIIFKILNDNFKYNSKPSAPNPFKSFKSLINFSLFIFHFIMQFLQGGSFYFGTLGHWDIGTTNFSVNFFSHLNNDV